MSACERDEDCFHSVGQPSDNAKVESLMVGLAMNA
jgi:hypothetical protein